jgi:hypothetical protein
MKELTEIKTMNYDRYEEHCESSNKLGIEVIEMGMHDTLDVAVEKETMLNENPEKFGHSKECETDIIRMIEEVPNDGGNDINEIGYLVLMYDSIKDDYTKEDAELLNMITNHEDEILGVKAHAKGREKQSFSHSEQRNMDLSKLNLSPNKKGRGQHPNSKKNLKPYEKGVSGNPSGKPKKVAQLKEVLDWWGGLTEYDNWSWDKYTNRQMVVKGIWKRATSGNRQDLDILLSLGLLDSDKFKN